jgi:hypothetical protein
VRGARAREPRQQEEGDRQGGDPRDEGGLSARPGVARAPRHGGAVVGPTRQRQQDQCHAYPSEKQVLTYMATMSRGRQRMCLAQRGVRGDARARSGAWGASTCRRWQTTCGARSKHEVPHARRLRSSQETGVLVNPSRRHRPNDPPCVCGHAQ